MAELPRGTVTLLFTDIEGSTRLLEQLGDRYSGVLDAHRGILRKAVEAREGREVDTQGDSFFFEYNLKRIGIDVQIQYFRSFGQMIPKSSVRGAPYDLIFQGWFVDYADLLSFFTTLNGNLQPTGNSNAAYFDNPKYNREIARIGRLSGNARARAWADLDVEMMRDDPPWAPFMIPAGRDFVSASLGCYVYHPVYGFDFAAACKR